MIDCDKLAHKAYEKGTSCYNKAFPKNNKKIIFKFQMIDCFVLR